MAFALGSIQGWVDKLKDKAAEVDKAFVTRCRVVVIYLVMSVETGLIIQ
jgi:hypothetical protein